MLKEVSDSLKLSLYERATSPLIGVFLLSWLAYNWRIPLVLFWGNGSIQERIKHVETQYLKDIDTYFYDPIIFATGTLFLYPLVAILPFVVWQKSNFWKVRLQQIIHKNQLLTLEQSEKIKTEIRELKMNHIAELSKQEEQATATINEKQRELIDFVFYSLIDNVRRIADKMAQIEVPNILVSDTTFKLLYNEIFICSANIHNLTPKLSHYQENTLQFHILNVLNSMRKSVEKYLTSVRGLNQSTEFIKALDTVGIK